MPLKCESNEKKTETDMQNRNITQRMMFLMMIRADCRYGFTRSLAE